MSINAKIYGISFSGDLVSYDINTGNMTIIATPIGTKDVITTNYLLGCLDPINAIYFFLYINKTTNTPSTYTGLYAYNLNNVSKIYSPIKLPYIIPSNIIPGGNDACTQNPNTGEIYIWGHDSIDTTIQYLLTLKFNPQTGNALIKKLNSYNNINGYDTNPMIGYMAPYDTKRNYLWLAGANIDKIYNSPSYFYIDGKTGLINDSIAFPDLKEFIGSGEYNFENDKIVGIYCVGPHDNSEQFFDFRFTYYDPITLKPVKSFDKFKGLYFEQTPIWTIDNDKNIFYQLMFQPPDYRHLDKMDGKLIGLNVKDGSTITNITICSNGIESCPWDIQYYSG